MVIDSMQTTCGATIIIPTTCSRERSVCLLRAIDSALCQAMAVQILVIVNGDRVCSELFERLWSDNRVQVFCLEEGNVSKARYFGIIQAKYNCFLFLDDDDELLPNTLKNSWEVLDRDEEACVVVSNGYFFGSKETLCVDDALYQKIQESMPLSFLERNWFAAPAALYKKSRIDVTLFDIDYRFFEISYIFFKLIENRYKILFINNAAYKCYEDTVFSASKSDEYMLSYPRMLQCIIAMQLSREIKARLRKKFIVSLNTISNYFLQQGDLKKAFFYHVKCLLNGGLIYIFYTRHFFWPLIASSKRSS